MILIRFSKFSFESITTSKYLTVSEVVIGLLSMVILTLVIWVFSFGEVRIAVDFDGFIVSLLTFHQL